MGLLRMYLVQLGFVALLVHSWALHAHVHCNAVSFFWSFVPRSVLPRRILLTSLLLGLHMLPRC